MTLSVPRGVIEDRTCLGETAVKKALRVLLDHEILIQVVKPAPGRTAQFRLDYRALAMWLDPSDRQIIRLDNIRSDTGATRPRTQARRAPERRRDAPVSESTQARGETTQARSAQTQARRAPVIKEVTALPAKIPAAAAARAETAKTRTEPSAETQLANAAAAAAGVMDLGAWTRLGRKAGLDLDLAEQCGHTLIELGVEEAEIGRRALERLAERLGKIDNPIGFLRRLIGQDGGPEASKASVKRERLARQRREKLIEAMDTKWTPDGYTAVRLQLTAYLEHMLGEEVTRQLMPCEQYAKPIRRWEAMLDLIATQWEQIRQTPIREAVSA